MIFGTLFTLPSSAEILEDIGTTSAPIVTDFLPVVFVVAGVALGLFVVWWIIKIFTDLHKK